MPSLRGRNPRLGEDCGDGNLLDGDCCDSTCSFEASGSPCGDGSDTECTDPDTCDGAGTCQGNHASSGAACSDTDGNECTIAGCDGVGSCDQSHSIGHFVDNGDGTITDNQTGLMWEKKDNSGGIHDKDNRYTWASLLEDPDGTAFTVFLDTLNGGATGVGNCVDDGTYPPTGVTGGFAGHCDWRVPTIVELQTILLEPYPCSTSPCIDPIFGPTASHSYWSSTTNASDTDDAWAVDFLYGYVYAGFKSFDGRVRAVRGGS